MNSGQRANKPTLFRLNPSTSTQAKRGNNSSRKSLEVTWDIAAPDWGNEKKVLVFGFTYGFLGFLFSPG